MHVALRRSGGNDITKQLMLDSLLDDLTGSMASGADDGGTAGQAHAIGSILAAVRDSGCSWHRSRLDTWSSV